MGAFILDDAQFPDHTGSIGKDLIVGIIELYDDSTSSVTDSGSFSAALDSLRCEASGRFSSADLDSLHREVADGAGNDASIMATAFFGSLEEWLRNNGLQDCVPTLEQMGVKDVYSCLQLSNEELEAQGWSG